MVNDRADYDNVVWNRNDKVTEMVLPYLHLEEDGMFRHPEIGRTATWITPFRIGGYNNLYRIRIQGATEDVMLRLPRPSLNTQLPVPPVLFHGLSNPASEIGPFTIIQHVENCRSMSKALTMPNEDPNEPHMLDPLIAENILEDFYHKAAIHLIHLFESSLLRMGSLTQTDKDIFSVEGRPITQNMNNMIQPANVPRSALPAEDRTLSAADEWYIALAEMHIVQLVFQHNDLVISANDCRNKYVARQIFRKLAKQDWLSTFGFLEDD